MARPCPDQGLLPDEPGGPVHRAHLGHALLGGPDRRSHPDHPDRPHHLRQRLAAYRRRRATARFLRQPWLAQCRGHPQGDARQCRRIDRDRQSVSAAGDEAPVLSEVDEGVGLITLNRPDKLNAWTPAMRLAYFDVLERFAGDPQVRAIVVRGAGRGFCAGANLSLIRAPDAQSEALRAAESREYWFPLSIGKPLVAAIHGPCLGIGLQQAMFCDIRFAACDAKIGAPYVRRGIVGEMGITWMLSRLCGVGAANDIMLSGRTLSGEEAARIGLVNEALEPDAVFDRAMAYARDLAANCSPLAMRTVKMQLYHDLMDDFTPSFARSERLLDEVLRGEDVKEGIAAVREKRPVRFAGLDPRLARTGDLPK
ncbi:MAG: enoyl-CoA hydratase [Alphaproteobacteria bacterium]|nr:enoyl-CoA hydratase [Alphaproteobacteria bacterium]